MLWGISPALDLFNELASPELAHPDTLNILLVGGTDCRHVLKTLARRYRNPKQTRLNFYLAEACPETIAKQLLLLLVALQPSSRLGLVQKTRLFMELYGNTLIRPAVADFLTASAKELIRLITDDKVQRRLMPWLEFAIKYKERDYLENLFKFWAGGTGDAFEICQAWDLRVRKMLGTRYDTRLAAFDWDLHMRFHRLEGGSQVCSQEYKSFRDKGVPFTWLESEVSRGNRSMVTGLLPNGGKFAHYGYLGDVITGPFVAYGLHCEDKTFLRRTNNTNAHRATDITERNLRQIFHEIEQECPYEHVATNDITLGHIVNQLNDLSVVDTEGLSITTTKPDGCGDLIRTRVHDCINLEDVTIKFVSMKILQMLKHKAEYDSFFDVMYFGNCYVKYMDPDLLNHVAKEGAKLIVESQIFVVSYRDKELKEFDAELREKLQPLSKKTVKFDCLKDCFARYVINKDL